MSSVILKMLSSRPAVDMTMHHKRDVGNTAKFGVFVSKKCLDLPKTDYRNDRNRGFTEHSMRIDMPYFSAAHNF